MPYKTAHLTTRETIVQSMLVHPDWTADTHVEYLDGERPGWREQEHVQDDVLARDFVKRVMHKHEVVDHFSIERDRLQALVDQLGEAATSLREFAADHGPLGDPTLREACLTALAAGDVAWGAFLLARQARDHVPSPTVRVR